jgi:hypothetical protein
MERDEKKIAESGYWSGGGGMGFTGEKMEDEKVLGRKFKETNEMGSGWGGGGGNRKSSSCRWKN